MGEKRGVLSNICALFELTRSLTGNAWPAMCIP
jgi:hypothetical protein